ncbi:MAG: hypothetical protein IJX55_01985 [Clostridia bacterium]|nr:hypothetical protein [Clostridia bacterium]
MGKSNRKTPFVFYFGLVLLTLVMFSTHFMSGLYARYTTMANGGDDARVAKFEVSTAGNLTQSFELEMNPQSETQSRTITITNNSETTIKYTVKVESTGNLPLIFSWGNDKTSGTIAVGDTNPQTLNLNISWESEENSYLYSSEIDCITVTVVCEQVD